MFMLRRAVKVLTLFTLLAAAPAAAQHAPAIWKVQDEDATVYLFGTIHLLQPDTPWFSQTLEEILASADTLTLELSPEQMDPMTMQQLVAEIGFYPPGESLSDHVPEDLHGRIMIEAQKLGLPTQAVERMRPWMAGLTITVGLAAKAGYVQEHGAEAVLTGKAAEGGAEVRGLETAEQQLRIFAELSDEAQISWLRSGLDQVGDIDAFFQTMKGAWLKGDLEALEKLLVSEMETAPDLAEKLLYRRNKAWVPQIETLLDEPGVHVVAVGAGHLIGADSVPFLLRLKGYDPERL